MAENRSNWGLGEGESESRQRNMSEKDIIAGLAKDLLIHKAHLILY